MCTSSMACYATDSRKKKRFRVEAEGLVHSPVLTLYAASERTAHHIEWSAQRIVTA